MNTYLITFADGVTMEVDAIGPDGAQEVACAMCNEMDLVFGTIVSIKRTEPTPF